MTPPVAGFEVSLAYGVPGDLWTNGYHNGVDYACPVGTRVVSTVRGVVSSYNGGPAYGTHVVVDDGDRRHMFCHLSSRAVRAGDRVRPGDRVGLSGATGNVTGPHLHYEVRELPPGTLGSDIDPAPWIGEEMPLTDDDVAKIARAVWAFKIAELDPETEPTEKAAGMVTAQTHNRVGRIERKIDALDDNNPPPDPEGKD